MVADGPTASLLGETDRVVYDPDTGKWAVVFGQRLDKHRMTVRRQQIEAGAEEWSDLDEPPSLPQKFASHLFQGDDGLSRWRTCRKVWGAMATVGEAPSSFSLLKVSSVEDAEEIPGWPSSVSGEEFVSLLKESDSLNDLLKRGALKEVHLDRRIAEHVVQSLGLSDELEDVKEATPTP